MSFSFSPLFSPCLRDVHPITLRTGVEGVAKPPAALPSDNDPAFTYGKPAAYRCAPQQHLHGRPCHAMSSCALLAHVWTHELLVAQMPHQLTRSLLAAGCHCYAPNTPLVTHNKPRYAC